MSKTTKQLRNFRDLIFRRFPSETHKKKFANFEHILEYRTLASQCIRAFNFALLFPLGMLSINSAEAYIEEEGPRNIEFARIIFPYAKWGIFSLSVVRMILLIATRWKFSILKYIFYL